MDETKLHEFLGKVVTDMGGAWMMAMVLIGDELGLYKAMADNQPVSADEVARRSSCHPRLVREWLDANAAAGYVEAANGAYRLPPEQAMALANEDSPVFVAPGQSVIAACFMDLDKLLAAFRGNGAFPWGEHHHRMFHGVEKFFRPGYQAHLTTSWLPALEGVVDKLTAGAKVADVGCGHGVSTIVMAKAYPKSRFFGFDFHAPSIEVAGQRADRSGSRRPCELHEGDRPGVCRAGVRPHLLLRLPARHGRSRRGGAPRSAGPRGRWLGALGGAIRGR